MILATEQATAVVVHRATVLQNCVTGRSRRSRAADRQVLVGIDAVTMATEQLLLLIARGR